MFAKENDSNIMKKVKKQFKKLSDEDLEKVTGGGLIQLINMSNCQYFGMVDSTDENGNPICVSA